ncbi:MAG: GNAT family N-acetyltransferase [bacterium]
MKEKQNIKIRRARIDDEKLLLDFIRQLAEYEKLSDEITANEELIKNHFFSNSKIAECLIAEYNENPVGFAVFFHNFSTFKGKPGLYLEDLFVNPEMRGKGVGKALLIELAKIAKARDCARFEWSVLNWNQSAIDFYKSLGAVPMSDWTVFRLDNDGINILSEANE